MSSTLVRGLLFVVGLSISIALVDRLSIGVESPKSEPWDRVELLLAELIDSSRRDHREIEQLESQLVEIVSIMDQDREQTQRVFNMLLEQKARTDDLRTQAEKFLEQVELLKRN